jgi:hypothetical protein
MNSPHFSTSPSGSPVSSPRVLCRVVRQWCAIAGSQSSRHVASCAECQRYFARVSEFDHALRRDAMEITQINAVGTDSLERQILRAVRNSAPARRADSRPQGWLLGGLAAAAAIAIGAVLFHGSFPGSSQEQIARANPMPAAADAEIIVDAVESLSYRLVDSVIPTTGEFVATNPLQREMSSVYSDARSAVDFLALNFLPRSRPLTPATQSRRI